MKYIFFYRIIHGGQTTETQSDVLQLLTNDSWTPINHVDLGNMLIKLLGPGDHHFHAEAIHLPEFNNTGGPSDATPVTEWKSFSTCEFRLLRLKEGERA